MFEQELEYIGLSRDAAKIYSYLSINGASSATYIARQTGIQRTNVYLVTKELINQGLLSKSSQSKVTQFQVTAPEYLNQYIDNQTQVVDRAQRTFLEIEQKLRIQYDKNSGRPIVRFYEGITGLKKIYQDINSSDIKELWLVRSRIGASPEMRELIREQRRKQIANKIKVHVFNSTEDSGIETKLGIDTESNTERRVLAASVFKNNAQILLYGSKVAFSTYSEPMVTTVIENQDVVDTLKATYQILWQKTAAESGDNVKKILKKRA